MVAARVCESSGDTSVTPFSSPKRSGESVHGSTLASPRTPWGLRITPTATRSDLSVMPCVPRRLGARPLCSVEDVEDVAAGGFGARGGGNRANGPGRATLPANELAGVCPGGFPFQPRWRAAVPPGGFPPVACIAERTGEKFT